MDVLTKLQKQKDRCSLRLQKLNQQIAVEESKLPVGCFFCGKQTPVGELTYIQTHWYTPPSGCTDGDYWNNGEGQFQCPCCNKINRLYNRKEVEKLKNRFKDVRDVYER